MTMAQRIRTLRKALKFTQKDLAKKSGVAQSLITYLEKGGKTTHLSAIADALHTDVQYLETGEKPPEIGRRYSPRTEAVIKLMESTDERGQLKLLIGAQDILDEYTAWKESLPTPQEPLGASLDKICKEMLPEFIETQSGASDVDKTGGARAQRAKRH